MVIPINYRKSAEGAIASYDYSDVVDGTGIVVYYCGSHKEQTTEGYFIARQNLYSKSIFTSSTIDCPDYETDFILVADKDFDIFLNAPRTMKGTARVIVNVGGSANYDTGQTYVIAKIRKYSDSTETEIASAQTPTLALPNTSYYYELNNLQITVPNTTFKSGDILRLTIEQYGRRVTGTTGTQTARFAHDPMNRTTTEFGTTPTILEFHAPFKIDL